MENRSRFLSAVVMVVVIVVLGFTVFKSEAQSNGEIGRYQVATSYRENGNWVFVTVIDTMTGDIVRQEQFNAYDAYEKKK